MLGTSRASPTRDFVRQARERKNKKTKSEEDLHPLLILPHVKKWGRNYLDALQPWQIEKSVTYVAGLKCYLCRRSFKCLARGIREGMLRVRGWYNSADAIARYFGRPAASFVRGYQSESALGTGRASFRGTRKSVLALVARGADCSGGAQPYGGWASRRIRPGAHEPVRARDAISGRAARGRDGAGEEGAGEEDRARGARGRRVCRYQYLPSFFRQRRAWRSRPQTRENRGCVRICTAESERPEREFSRFQGQADLVSAIARVYRFGRRRDVVAADRTKGKKHYRELSRVRAGCAAGF